MTNLKKGDLVKLKSGSPIMTVHSFTQDGKVKCVFFDENKNDFIYNSFEIELLDSVIKN